MLKKTFVFVDLPGDGFVPAGLLEIDCRPGHVELADFRYGSLYAERPNAISIDPLRLPLLPKDKNGLMPVQSIAVEGELVGAIRDSSPDGFGRLVLARAFKQAQLDEYEYLTASGSHRVGALAFGADPNKPPHRNVPKGYSTEYEELDIDSAVAGYDALLREDFISKIFERFVDAAGALGGARPKAAVILDGRQWLAKFTKPEDTYDAIRVEAAVMNLAAEYGFDVPAIRVEKSGENSVFLIERFDREVDENGKTISRTPFVSAMSTTGHTEMTARYGSYEEISDSCRKFGTHVEADRKELFKRAAFNILTGNDDDHLRNHGFLYDHSKRSWNLSPLYDVSPRPQTSSMRKLAIAMTADDTDRPSSLHDVIAAAPAFGIRQDEAAAICENMRSFVDANWQRHMKEIGLPESQIPLIAGCFNQAEQGNTNTNTYP